MATLTKPTSKLSLGCSAFGSVYQEMTTESCCEIIKTAFENDIRLVDTAPWYQTSEEVIGNCLTRLAPSYPRSSYILNTKVGRYPDWHPDSTGKVFDFSRKTVLASFATSLKRLQTDYIDTIQVHDIEFAEDIEEVINETLPALDNLRKAGKAKRIGITSYDIKALRLVCERSPVRIDSVLSYCRYTLHDRSLYDSEFMDFLEARGIEFINAAAIGMGLLSHEGPPAWHPASNELKARAAEAACYCKDQGVDISKLALGYVLSQKRIPTTLVSCVNMQQMNANLSVLNNGLSSKEQQCTDTLLSKWFVKSTHWEGVEMAKYKAEAQAAKAVQKQRKIILAFAASAVAVALALALRKSSRR